MRERLRHPFWIAIIVLLVAYVIIEYGIAYIPPLLGVRSAPVPDSVVLEYMAIALVGVLLWVSSSEDRWAEFKAPIHETMVSPDRKLLRGAFLVLIPLLVGFMTYEQVRPRVAAPPSLRSIHPAPPSQISFQGSSMTLTGLENPLRADGLDEYELQLGKDIYYRNCMPCHGDALAGDGHFAHGFNPTPLNFRDNGTIAQLSESFVFWRVAKGGPGLPTEGTPWASAMPAWEDFLTEDEIWAVTAFIYEQSGWEPRQLTAGHESEGGH